MYHVVFVSPSAVLSVGLQIGVCVCVHTRRYRIQNAARIIVGHASDLERSRTVCLGRSISTESLPVGIIYL